MKVPHMREPQKAHGKYNFDSKMLQTLCRDTLKKLMKLYIYIKICQ